MGLGARTQTPAQWKQRLSTENVPVTLDEYNAGTMIRIMGALIELVQSVQHIEGMLGAMDEACAREDPDYAGSSLIREALWKQRRALAALADNPEASALTAQVRDALAPGRR